MTWIAQDNKTENKDIGDSLSQDWRKMEKMESGAWWNWNVKELTLMHPAGNSVVKQKILMLYFFDRLKLRVNVFSVKIKWSSEKRVFWEHC